MNLFMNLIKKLVIKNLNVFCHHKGHPHKKPRFMWTIKYLGATLTFFSNGELMSAFKLPDTRQAALSVSPVDALGVPAPIDGIPEWASSDETVATVAVSEDGSSIVVTPASPVKLGITQVSASFDADLGEGVVTITEIIEIEVVASQAVGATITATLIDLPVPPPVEPAV
jgi:hypothetical protein